MANYESAEITTENKEVFESLEEFFEQEDNHFGFYDSTDGKIVVRNRHGYTIEGVIEISKLFKDVPIQAVFAFESERYWRDHTYKVTNGKLELIDIVETVTF